MKLLTATSFITVAWFLLPVCPGQESTPAPRGPFRDADVIAHLARTISWYRRVIAVEQSAEVPASMVVRDSTQRGTTRALHLAFDFARAAAPLVSTDQKPGGSGSTASPNLEQAAARAAERVTKAEAGIAEVDAALGKTAEGKRATLMSRRKELQAELNLAKEIQETLRGLRTLAIGQAAGGGLLSYIERLERSVPEAMRATQSTVPVPTGPPEGRQFHPESAGIFELFTEALTMTRSASQLRDALAETVDLGKNVDQLRAPLVSDLRSVIRRSDEATNDSASQDARQMDADRKEIEALTARFKHASSALAPLREQGLLIESTRGSLLEWRNRADQQYKAAVSYLVFRVLALIGAIAVVFAISELWRRATFRYVQDARRRRQFLLIRRVVVSGVVAVAVLFGLATEVGSMATYAGFLTAGLAVALQNVISSVVAYFFLSGRYGLRAGDRVTISGVTGDVLDIGLVRIYLMELTGTGANLEPTGRVVAFSNSVVFQPAALFKQMPGTNYVWHTVTLTLTPDSDFQIAESRLTAAVEGVYEKYRGSIEKQHAAFQRLVDVPMPPPRPAGRLRFTDSGLEFTVRYPAEMPRAAATGDQVVNALTEAIGQEPRLSLARAGAPKVQD